MFTFSNANIRIKLATAAVVAAGALALPAVASAQTATGCGPLDNPDGHCVFVGGVGADHTTTPPTGGATQFQVNTGGAIVTCDDSRATAVTAGTDLVDVELQFEGCEAEGFPATVSCDSTPITITNVTVPGVADGYLELGPEDCTITVTAFGIFTCTIKTARVGETHNIPGSIVNAVGGDGFSAVLTVPVAGNTDALTFSASGAACTFANVPGNGTARFSNDPIGAPSDLVYTEVGDNLDIR